MGHRSLHYMSRAAAQPASLEEELLEIGKSTFARRSLTVHRALAILLNPDAAITQGEGRETIAALEKVRVRIFEATQTRDPALAVPDKRADVIEQKNGRGPDASANGKQDAQVMPAEEPQIEKKKRGRPKKVIPETASAPPALASVKWTQWTAQMKCAFLEEVAREQKKKKEGAIKRVSDAYGVPAGKYAGWKEEFPNGFVPPVLETPAAAPTPALEATDTPAEPTLPTIHTALPFEPEIVDANKTVQAAPDSAPEPGSVVADVPSEPTVTDMKVDQAESPVRYFVPDETGIAALANSVHRLTGVESIDHATLVRTLCSAFGKLAYDIAKSVHSEDNTGWSHNLLKSKAIGALIDIATNFTGTKEEFPNHARPLIRQCLLLLPKSRQ